ncbi:MAG: hypothetical protein EZS28_013625 [Streblomastix strix]|uniref:Uncharacterized protein n=1 Tax=Streblomastix strix TaxID=222440 RepID=A0A5J4W7L2_9EUKA|nr:MAG: hypothetical protein EZS28_013625 [Streblomastix strix]
MNKQVKSKQEKIKKLCLAQEYAQIENATELSYKLLKQDGFTLCDIIATNVAKPWNVKKPVTLIKANRVPSQARRTNALSAENQKLGGVVDNTSDTNPMVLEHQRLTPTTATLLEYTTLPTKYWRVCHNDSGYQNKEMLSTYLIDVVFPGIMEVRNESQEVWDLASKYNIDVIYLSSHFSTVIQPYDRRVNAEFKQSLAHHYDSFFNFSKVKNAQKTLIGKRRANFARAFVPEYQDATHYDFLLDFWEETEEIDSKKRNKQFKTIVKKVKKVVNKQKPKMNQRKMRRLNYESYDERENNRKKERQEESEEDSLYESEVDSSNGNKKDHKGESEEDHKDDSEEYK